MSLINCKMTAYQNTFDIGATTGTSCENQTMRRAIKLVIRPRASWFNSLTGHTHEYRIAASAFKMFNGEPSPENITNYDLGHLSIGGELGRSVYVHWTGNEWGERPFTTAMWKNSIGHIPHEYDENEEGPSYEFQYANDNCNNPDVGPTYNGLEGYNNEGYIPYGTTVEWADFGKYHEPPQPWDPAQDPANKNYNMFGLNPEGDGPMTPYDGTSDGYSDADIFNIHNNYVEKSNLTALVDVSDSGDDVSFLTSYTDPNYSTNIGSYSAHDIIQCITAVNTLGLEPMFSPHYRAGLAGNIIIVFVKLRDNLTFTSDVKININFKCKAYEIIT